MNYADIFDFWNKLTDKQQQELSSRIYEKSFENNKIVNNFNEGCKGVFAVKKRSITSIYCFYRRSRNNIISCW
ncbi:hypothetical protein [Clostridium sp. SM-530-WT-3G]|uniref:hypothetical protein n=1 Tax=Clostridium sp. SM-530-WT-3G TaxID=2725303 RepID=UPI00145FA48F|nr:hypothetical protein [Clostridium sp. SM-530-WT-3G]NME81611.1 hypothetical protein [Clostridium sp. SM-530-WT-3G]